MPLLRELAPYMSPTMSRISVAVIISSIGLSAVGLGALSIGLITVTFTASIAILIGPTLYGILRKKGSEKELPVVPLKAERHVLPLSAELPVAPLSAELPVAPVSVELPVVPLSVNYHFTRRCNYKCGFCFHTAITSFELPLDQAKKGLGMLKDAGMIISILSCTR